MREKRIFVILSMVMLFFLLLSFASASENETLPTMEGQYTLCSADDNILSDSSNSFTKLDEKIQSSGSGSTVVLDRNYSYVNGDNKDGIAINKDITIDGKGYTLNGAGKSSIFHISGNSKVTLKNINFINAYGENGSALSWTADDDVNVINSKFINNSASGNGAAIYIVSTSTLTANSNITNSLFINNKASNGGAIYASGTVTTVTSSFFNNNSVSGNGGSIFLDAGAYIDNCIFTFSQAKNDGGALYVMSTLSDLSAVSQFNRIGVFNSRMISCSAGRDGGAGYVNAKGGIVSNVTVINSSAGNNGGAGYIDGDWGKLINSTFINNTASKNGGAVMWTGINGTIYGSNYINNTAVLGDGGALYLSPLGKEALLNAMTILNCSNFNNNTATFNGGAVYCSGIFTAVFNSNFSHDKAYTGAGIYLDVGAAIGNCSFYKESATYDGGAIYLFANNQEIRDYEVNNPLMEYVGAVNSKFIECNAGHNGGGAYVAGDYGIVRNVVMIANVAGYDGGAGYIAGSYGKIYNSTLIANKAIRDGGALAWAGDYGIVNNVSGIQNSAAGGSGSICVYGSNIQISDSTFQFSNSTLSGGAIYVYGDNVNITNSLFDRCAAEAQNGGAISISGLNTHITGCNFTMNKVNVAISRGGAIYVQGNGTQILGCNFDRCTALEGGFVYINGTNVIIDKAIGFHSFAVNGGAFYIMGNNAVISNSIISNNNATTFAGAIYVAGDFAKINNVSFARSIAYTRDGGAVYIKGLNASISNSSFVQNIVAGQQARGGAINVNGDYTHILNCTFDMCTAYDGGVIYIEGAHVLIDGYSCIHSLARNNGGAIYVEGDYATIADFDISLTNATNFGGAIYVEGDFAIINNSLFTRCIADNYHGGALYVVGLNASVFNSYFIQNRVNVVNGRGGSIAIDGNFTHILNCSFDMCTAFEGGVVYINGSNAFIEGYSCIRSFAHNNGGAIYVEGDYATIADFNVSLTNATNFGGAVYVEGDFTNIRNSNFTRCIADNYHGGALYVAGLNTTISNSYFLQNRVNTIDGRGGSVDVDGDYTKVLNCTFIMCNAYEGGVVYINGSNVLVDGYSCMMSYATNNGGAFYIAGDYVTVKNFNVSMANATNFGGAVYVAGNHLDIDGSNFTRCIADNYHGGALYVAGLNTTVSNSHFVQNRVNVVNGRGGSIEIQGVGTNVLNCSFDMCTAYEGGIIYVNGSDARIDGYYSTHSIACNDGGAIYIAGDNVQLNDFTITFTNATNNGGAIYITGDDVDIANGNINTCIADNGEGGSIYVGGYNTTIRQSSFFQTQAPNGNGGAIFVEGDLATVSDSNFTHSFSNNGGVIYIKGQNAEILHDDFKFVYCIENGGAIYVEGNDAIISGDFSFTNASSKNNEYAGFGGAIYVFGDNVNITSSAFFVTTAEKGGSGGAIFISGDNVNIEYSNFTNCFAPDYFDEGSGASGAGAISIAGDDASVIKSQFVNCFARNGGVMFIAGSSALIENSKIINSFAYSGGGALYIFGENTNISNTSFINTHSNNRGGAIYIRFGEFTKIEESDFINCNSTYGGAIDIDGNNTKITESGMINCSAVVDGGAIYVHGDNVSITDSDFINCTADEGNAGAIYWIGSHGVTGGSNFINNAAPKLGGAIYLRENSDITFQNTNFINNSAGINGGAIDFNHGAHNGAIINSTFINNCANRSAGAVFWSGTNGTIKGSTFVNNMASGIIIDTDGGGDGGAVLWIGHDGNILNSKFTNNTAGFSGGAVYLKGSNEKCNNISIVGGIFNGNSAGLNGGAVDFQKGAENCQLIGATFINNTALRNGGAVFWYGHNGTVIKCNFIENEASGLTDEDARGVHQYIDNEGNKVLGGSGGAVAWIGDLGLIKDSNFINNTVKRFGGAVFLRDNVNTSFNGDIFTANTAMEGGALYWDSQSNETLFDTKFMKNVANKGSAIYLTKNNLEIINSILLDNKADSQNLGVEIIRRGDAIDIVAEFKGNDNLINAIWNDGSIGLTNVTYLGVNGVTNTGNVRKVPIVLIDDVKPGDNRLYQTQYEAGQNITFYIYDNKNNLIAEENVITNNSGVAKLSLTNVEEVYEFVLHPDDDYYTGIENSTSKKIVDIEIPTEDIDYLENKSFTVTIADKQKSEIPTGTVSLYLNGLLVDNYTLVGGKTPQINLNNLKGGLYNVSVKYMGDEKFLPKEYKTSFNVNRISSFVIVSVENYTCGESGKIIINAVVNENNTVNITLNNKTYGVKINKSGYGELIIPEMSYGIYKVDAVYPDTKNYLKSSNSTVFEIYPIINVNIFKSVNATEAFVNDLINFTIVVSNDGQITATNVCVSDDLANGLEYVSSNGMYSANRTITWTVGNISAGEKVSLWVAVRPTLNQTFANTAQVNSSESGVNKSQEVYVRVSSIVDLVINKTVNQTSAFVGDEIRYVITVCNNGPSNATDVNVIEMLSKQFDLIKSDAEYGIYNPEVGIWNIGRLNCGETATLTLDVKIISIGESENVVYVQSNEKELNESNNIYVCENVSVEKRDSPISLEVNNITYGDDEELIITLPKNASGFLTVFIEGLYNVTVPLLQNQYKSTFYDLSAGNYSVFIKYSGDDSYKANSTYGWFNVAQFIPSIKIEVADILEGEVEVLNVTVNAPGSVNITVNGVTVEIQLDDEIKTSELLMATDKQNYNGTATWYLFYLSHGKYSVRAVYNGNENYASVSASDVFYVRGNLSNVHVDVKDIFAGQTQTIKVIYPADATGEVTISVGGKKYIASLKNGVATFKIPNLKAGLYNVDISYSGDEQYLPKTSKNSFNIFKLKPKVVVKAPETKVGKFGTVTVTLPHDATGTISLEISGKWRTAPIKNGKAVFILKNLNFGEYDISIYYPGDEKYLEGYAFSKIAVDFDDTNQDNGTDYGSDKINDDTGINLANYPTANPMFILFLTILIIGFGQIKGFKKE